ncbi:MAG TPA: serine/threonine-protein kinase [Actinospica sp.]|nr:serine/threonine-protein kinase [Actinospica sp.]
MLRLGGDDPERLGPYRLKAVIGDGGMGRVYLGTSPGGRAVAVKVIGRGLANQPGYRERFAREARAAMAVSGLYTASVVDADTTGEAPYLATEFVPAPSLAEAVGKTGPLPAAAVSALAGGMAEALVAIHRAGLVHRDVKPHNILLAADGPVVIDFGIAVGGEASLTATGLTVGTPGYMAPEVLRGKDPSAVSDVFSLACVLVFAARGTGPFGTGDPLAVAHRSANGEPDLSGLPEEVRALVTPMLQRDPARRPTPAQLLQHVSLSSSAILHDGLWLPESVRNLLNAHRLEVQQALNSGGNGGGIGGGGPGGGAVGSGGSPTAPAPPGTGQGTPAAYQSQDSAQGRNQAQGQIPGQAQGRFPYGLRPPAPGTPAQDFAAVYAASGAKPPESGPSHRRFYALLGAGGALVMAGAIVAVLVLADGGGGSGANGSQTGTSTVRNLAAGSSAASTASASDTVTASGSDTGGATSTDTSVAHYRPGTYKVNQTVATDLLGDTVSLISITVDGDGTVSALLSYTDAVPGEWTCAAAKPGEATLSTDSGADDASTASDCTKDPGKTWYLSAGQSASGAEYFGHAPAGAGDWTFSMNSLTVDDVPEFQGSVSGISIPTE